MTVQLTDGKSLDGWTNFKSPGVKPGWQVKDGTLACIDPHNAGDIVTADKFDWFELQIDYNISEGGNSGIFFRLIPGTEKAPSNGYEFQINNALIDGNRAKPKDAGTGAIFRRSTARWVVANDREWFTATLVAYGPRFCGWVNGLQVTDFEDTRPADANPRKGQRLEAGPFSLQGHDPTTNLSFRNMRIVSLDSK